MSVTLQMQNSFVKGEIFLKKDFLLKNGQNTEGVNIDFSKKTIKSLHFRPRVFL
jgi:hypothetical protein